MDVRDSAAKLAVSQKFQKKTQLEHILLRPDTYIGSVERVRQPMHVLEAGPRIVEREIGFVPGLFKIFDEILVNAADNKKRDPSMSSLRVDIDRATGEISVRNDGRGIPVEMHAEHGVYIPELVFGHLLTGENFEDSEERVVGGRNGYGAKLANIFSKRFTVETQEMNRLYRQTWEDNMTKCGKPQITTNQKKDHTRVTFVPDYARFGMDGLDDDTVALLHKRVYDMAGVTDKSVKVQLNGETIAHNTFEKYVGLYLDAPAEPEAESKSKRPRIYARVNERWEVCVTTTKDGSPTQISFVNAICTYKGGQHVAYIQDQICKAVMSHVQRKNKAHADVIKPAHVKNHTFVFVNALVVNPAFDSQTKENLTTRPPKFGPKEFMPDLSEQFLSKIVKSSGIVENVLYWAQAKQAKDLKKVGGAKRSKLLDIPKLDDANWAGGRRSEECTLILTEGDSAKSLALSGISVVGRDKFGVFPLKGKLLNVRDAAHAQIMKNVEIQNIMRIVGLRPGETDDVSKLRYGHVMIMTDQDQDGSHIKGLLFNFFHHFFPKLLEIKGFLRVFVTPIVKVSRGSEALSFYSLHEYNEWRRTNPGTHRVKYYKGLGTSSSKEAQEYFAAIEDHVIDMTWSDVSSDALDMAFSKSRVEDRKRWLSTYDVHSGPRVDFRAKTLEYRDFVQGELVHFSLSDNVRSIPSVFDGLKPSQRKVLFACFKRKLVSEIKVSQLSGYISENAAYHHGEESLSSTIVGMAQTFVGSNNVALLHAGGAFGTRRMGGKDAASSRYIHTRLEPVARALFPVDDDALYVPLEDDGQLIEPKHYVPILPLLLVNGASGIGTGWSTEIPPFNPRDVSKALRRKIKGLALETPLIPWYRGFQGEIEADDARKRFTVRGEAHLRDTTLIVSELPVGKWTAAYKEHLLELMTAPKGAFPEGAVRDVKEHHTDDTVLFEIELGDEFAKKMADLKYEELLATFQLVATVSTSNMHAFDESGTIRKYDTPEAILDAFVPVRRDLYAKRKAHLEAVLAEEADRLEAQARFVRMVVEGTLVVANKRKDDVLARLRELKFKGPDYDYLLSMSIWALTLEKVQSLEQRARDKVAELKALQCRTVDDLWLSDLDAFETALENMESELEKLAEAQEKARAKAGNKRPAFTRRGTEAARPEKKRTKDASAAPPKKSREDVSN